MQKYEPIRVLGEGSFGKVYLMRDKQQRKMVCTKVIRIKNIPRKEREACRTEVELLRRLNHPNIVSYIESFLTKNKESLCIVMEYCDGGDLCTQIKNARRKLFSESKILHWFVQIALGLHYMHSNRILHRDLKTQNIFLLGNGRLVLGDLGISKVLDGTMDFAQTCIGTPYYMSPEIFKNKPYNHKSDVWALGCVLYEITTLNHAFDANSLNGLAAKIIRGRYPNINPKYSRHLQRLIDQMLCTNPSERPDIEQVLRQPFIRKHVQNFFHDIAIRPRANIGEGTMAVRAGAVLLAAENTDSVSAQLSQSPDVRALKEQLEALGMQSVIQQALSPPERPTSARGAKKLAKRQASELRREEDHKRMVEAALKKLREERVQRRESRAQVRGARRPWHPNPRSAAGGVSGGGAGGGAGGGGVGVGAGAGGGRSNAVAAPHGARGARYGRQPVAAGAAARAGRGPRVGREREREREQREREQRERELREQRERERKQQQEQRRRAQQQQQQQQQEQRRRQREQAEQQQREEQRRRAQQQQHLEQQQQRARDEAAKREERRTRERERQRQEIEKLRQDKLELDRLAREHEERREERRTREKQRLAAARDADQAGERERLEEQQEREQERSHERERDRSSVSVAEGKSGDAVSKRDRVMEAKRARVEQQRERELEALSQARAAARENRRRAVDQERGQYVGSSVPGMPGQDRDAREREDEGGYGERSRPGSRDKTPRMGEDELEAKLSAAKGGGKSRVIQPRDPFANVESRASKADADEVAGGEDELREEESTQRVLIGPGVGADAAAAELELAQPLHASDSDTSDSDNSADDEDEWENKDVDDAEEEEVMLLHEEVLQQELQQATRRCEALRRTLRETRSFYNGRTPRKPGAPGGAAGGFGGAAAGSPGTPLGRSPGEATEAVGAEDVIPSAIIDEEVQDVYDEEEDDELDDEEEDEDEDEEDDEEDESVEPLRTPRRNVSAASESAVSAGVRVPAPAQAARAKSLAGGESKSDAPTRTPQAPVPEWQEAAPSPQGRLADRIRILRQRCVDALGDDVFNQVYAYLKEFEEAQFQAGGEAFESVHDAEEAKASTLLAMVGEENMNLTNAMEQLIFLEETVLGDF